MHIQTVSGPVEPDRLGGVLMHEHVGSLALDGFYSGGSGDAGLVAEALQGLPGLGIGAIVDLTGRTRVETRDDLRAVATLAEGLGLHIVAGFSFYKDPWLGPVATSDLDQVTDIYIDQAVTGTNGVKAGVYGEVGTSLDEITAREELHLRAAARASVDTGLAISTHCTLGTMAVDQAKILLSEGADPSRVVMGHMDLEPDLDYLAQVLDNGVNLGFDTWGKEWFDYRVPGSEDEGPGEFVKWAYRRTDKARIAAVAELCARGFDDRLVLSCDMSGAEAWLNLGTHGRHGFSYLPTVVLP
ncbi:MAG: phosphotriesterase family protein, partial [Acidimicrobiia bacterium]